MPPNFLTHAYFPSANSIQALRVYMASDWAGINWVHEVVTEDLAVIRDEADLAAALAAADNAATSFLLDASISFVFTTSRELAFQAWCAHNA